MNAYQTLEMIFLEFTKVITHFLFIVFIVNYRPVIVLYGW